MRVVAALSSHETNTFSPVPTPLRAIRADGGPYWAEAAEPLPRHQYATWRLYHWPRPAGRDPAVPVAGEAWPSAGWRDDAYQKITDAIVAESTGAATCCLLDLHGAMARSLDDGEGALVARSGESQPELPIGLSPSISTPT